MEQDDTMENTDVNNDETNTYSSHYPDSRRYSMANSMTSNSRPHYRTDNMGYSVDTGGTTDDDDDHNHKKEDTKINIPASSLPPQYSTLTVEKFSDKRVKVRILNNVFNITTLNSLAKEYCLHIIYISQPNQQYLQRPQLLFITLHLFSFTMTIEKPFK